MSVAFVDGLPRADLPDEPWADAPFTWLGAALDRAALKGMRLTFAASLQPSPHVLESARTSMRPYLTAALRAEPRRFLSFVDRAAPRCVVSERVRRKLSSGELVERQFKTRYEPYHRSDFFPTCAENDVLAIQHWTHTSGSAWPTVIALHGFTMGQPAVDAHVLMAAQWYEVGFDVVLPTLPCHGVRAPQESRYSGEHFGSWHVGCLNECVRQAVYDLHILKSWLAERSAAPIGLVGLSLGGYLTALAAGLFPDLAFVIPLAAPVCLAALPLRLFEAEAGESAPLALAALRRAYRVHSPLTYPLAVPNERVLIVAGRGDRIVPPEHPYRLWRHWGRPPIHWFSGSHTAPFRRDRIFTRILEHVAGLGLGSAAQARRKPASASAARGREEGDAG